MNATFSGIITLSNIRNDEGYTLTGEGHSSVGFANGKADVNLVEENGSTILNYHPYSLILINNNNYYIL